MKILLINDNHSPTGGAENYFFELKSKLKQQAGLHVFSIGFGDQTQQGDDFYVFKKLSSNVTKLLGRLLPQPFLLKRLRKQIDTFQPDIIHLHNNKQYSATVLKAIKSYPVVMTTHDFSVICPTSQNIHQDLTPCVTGLQPSCFWQHRVKFNSVNFLLMSFAWLINNRRLKNSILAFTAPSPFLTSYLQANRFTPAYYTPPFTNTKKLEDKATAIKPNHFLFAGSLAAHKGVTLLLDEFALAVNINPALTLDIAGFGPLEKLLQEKARQLKLEKQVRFVGWQKDLTTYYQQANALIFPSIGLESFGLVVSEAMSHARPVIGVNRGTTAWLVEDGKTGFLFDPLKKGDLADKILKLAGNTGLAFQLGKSGQTRIHQLIDNDAALDEIIKVYRETCRVD